MQFPGTGTYTHTENLNRNVSKCVGKLSMGWGRVGATVLGFPGNLSNSPGADTILLQLGSCHSRAKGWKMTRKKTAATSTRQKIT